ncbi:protein phosphatase 2C domain-containing protein [Actinopolyspora mortivallis]|uniref:protein phosphatase 2C domain-containing protein n=1 Tax=Actinopolyspora mortivallis TaxID=33906 RepID=UPI0003605092|nr:protein phosphatase 2C domain-containing protein [Actinopolyspora mortivallis]
MTTVESAGQAGAGREATSEDVVLLLPNAAAVLDGATSLRPTEYSGGWYAARLSEALRPRLRADEAGLPELLSASIAEVAGSHGLRPGDSPSSTVSLVRWDDSTVEALVLADSPVVALTRSGTEVVSDDRLAELGTGSDDGYRRWLRAGGGFDEHHFRHLREAVDATGRWRNVEGGFWVAEADPAAAHRAVRRSWPRDRLEAVLLASDGVSCGVDRYGSYPSWRSLFEHATSESPQAVLERVRAAEESDPDGTRWPRPKRHDDQALVVVRFD